MACYFICNYFIGDYMMRFTLGLLLAFERVAKTILYGVIIYVLSSVMNPTINMINTYTYANVKGYLLYHAHAGSDKNDGTGSGSKPKHKDGVPILQRSARDIFHTK